MLSKSRNLFEDKKLTHFTTLVFSSIVQGLKMFIFSCLVTIFMSESLQIVFVLWVFALFCGCDLLQEGFNERPFPAMGHKLRYHLKLRGPHNTTITTLTLRICTFSQEFSQQLVNMDLERLGWQFFMVLNQHKKQIKCKQFLTCPHFD